MRRTFLAIGLIISASKACVGTASQKVADPQKSVRAAKQQEPAEAKAIRANAEAFVKAFNAGDAKGVAAHWAADGEYVNEAGAVFKGRDAIEKEYAALFAEHPGVKLGITIESIQLVSPGVVMETGTAAILSPSSEPLTASRYTVVHVKRGDQWVIVSARDSHGVALSNYEFLADLGWIVGTWGAESEGSKIRNTCRWTLNRNFIQRSYNVSEGDRIIATGTQMIGWDPLVGSVTSWTFESNGGHGHGVWTKDGDRWIIESVGIEADGSESLAIDIITPVDKDRFTWQSIDRVVNDVRLPDIKEVEVKRVKSGK